jgi:hypothetical protein
MDVDELRASVQSKAQGGPRMWRHGQQRRFLQSFSVRTSKDLSTSSLKPREIG